MTEHPSEPKQPGTEADWPSRRAGLRNDIARAIHRYDNHHGLSGNDILSKHHRGEADAVLTLLYREWPWLQAEAEESSRPAPTACGHGPELDRLNAELDDYDQRAEQQKQRAERAEAANTRVRDLAGRIRQGVPWTANDDDIAAHILQALDGPDAEQPARTTAKTPAATEATDLREQLHAAIESELYEYRERTMWWPEGAITAEIARLATRGAMEVLSQQSAPPAWTPPPPGSTAEQLPETLLTLIRDRLPDYTSTACQTADTLACAACYPGSGIPRPQYDEIREHAERLHERCRTNQKFTGQLCACGCHPNTEEHL